MGKLVVEVMDASDLMPKDSDGSASAFVEVEFDGQRQRTQTIHKDLNPQWNQTLVFDLPDSIDLKAKTVEVVVYNDRQGVGHHKNFLGRVRIHGASVPVHDTLSETHRYPLDKRGLFSHIKGDIALRFYALSSSGGSFVNLEMPKKKTKQVRSFHSIGSNGAPRDDVAHHPRPPPQQHPHHSIPPQAQHPPSMFQFRPMPNMMQMPRPSPDMLRGMNPAMMNMMNAQRPNPAMMNMMNAPRPHPAMMNMMHAPGQNPAMMNMRHAPRPNPDFLLVETNPSVMARMRNRGGEKPICTYDMVEQMQYLYVNVVKARDLPAMDLNGSLDPYVEVKLGNYKGKTPHLEKNQNPWWGKVFAFAKERVQSHVLEVVLKDRDIGKDDFVGRVVFDLGEVPHRVPPDSPLAPQWYRLEDKRGVKTNRGEIMLAVWIGTQADEAFPEAWHSDAHDVSHTSLTNTRSKVYFSPKLYYLRVRVQEAQDLISRESGRPPVAVVKVMIGNQVRATQPSRMPTPNPVWNEELMFVASEPFEDFIEVSVDERVGPGKDEVIGREIIPMRMVPQRVETAKIPDPRWVALRGGGGEEDEKDKKKFASRILLGLCLEVGYHVLDESTHFSSDLQPSSKHLRKMSIGILEVGILSARNLHPMKAKDGRTTDAYCVAKYGNKWVRTRTLLDTLHPRWNEQYTWDVHDPCTVITIGVFDNCHIHGSKDDSRDQRIGKVRVRLSTLETNRIYTHYYPLLTLTPSGLKKHGEIQLAIRFTCTAWVNMVTQYGKPLLPKMHYLQPIPVRLIDNLRHQAMQIVAAKLSRAEPPLRRDVVEYMLDVDQHMWSLRRSKANFQRIMSLLAGVAAMFRWINDICLWRNPITTMLVHVLLIILICFPELILPSVFVYLFVIGMWNYRFRPRHPPHMDIRLSQAENAHPDELDEEFDTFPSSKPQEIVRMRYERMRSVGGRVQTVIGDLASQGERAQAILSWRDPRATAIFIILALVGAVVIYVTPMQVIAVVMGIYWLRHPRFRSRMPSVPVNFFKRLPAKSDLLL